MVRVFSTTSKFDFSVAVAMSKRTSGFNTLFKAVDTKSGKAAFAGKAASVTQEDFAGFTFAASDEGTLTQFKANMLFINGNNTNYPVWSCRVIDNPSSKRPHQDFRFEKTVGGKTNSSEGTPNRHTVVIHYLHRMGGAGRKNAGGGK